jgi:N-acetylmuramoyl-L-alanine amidase
MKILIDNGHGEETPGKRSPDGLFREYRYTREIAHKIVEKLKEQGYDAELLVPESEDISLQERTRRTNEWCGKLGADKVILVSVHCNAAGDSSAWMKARGWSAYTSKGTTKADELATILYKAAEANFINQKIRKDFSDGDPDFEESFYILRKTKCPAVLTENFFQDNKEDVSYLLSLEGRTQIVKTHIDGIINYVDKYGKD